MIKRLIPYIKGYEKPAIIAPVLVVLEVICELLLPLLMAEIIDVGINGGGGMPHILRMGGLMLVLAAIAMVCGVLSAKYAAVASQGFGANLRAGMFDRIQSFSFADIDRFSSASLITRTTNDVNAIQMMLAMGLRIVTRAPFMLVAALVLCIRINARLALILVGIIPVMAVAIGLLMKYTHKLFRIFQTRIDALNDTVQENLIAIRVVKAFVRAGYEKTKFQKVNDALTDAGLKAVGRMILIQPVMTICLNAASVLTLWFGGRMVMQNTGMEVGDLTSFTGYIFQILMSVMMVAMSLLHLTRARACAQRIGEVLTTVPDITDGGTDINQLPVSRGKVEFKNVSFKYLATGTGDDVLKDISFTVEPGQFVAVIGGTGVGKSSLVNLIPRFYDVTGGAVLLDGMDVRDYPLDALRGRIGMVLQNNVLFSGTIRENLLWGRPELTAEQKADCTRRGITEDELVEELMIQAAKDAQAYDFVMSFPDGFDTHIDQGGVNVSGGQKQRLCIARAMLKHPSVLILDDSTSAVDSATEAAIRESFHQNLADTTVIIIAQRISSVRYADRIIILDDDHIAAMGTHDQLMATSAIYQEIYQSQQEGVSEDG